MAKLFVGPWVGEFGIEILHWQGFARFVARERNWEEVHVCSRPDRALFYEDFCDQFLAYDPKGQDTAGRVCKGYDRTHNPWTGVMDQDRGDIWLTPHKSNAAFKSIIAMAATRSTFRDFASGAPQPDHSYDILIHARATNKAGQAFKNWPISDWEHFVEALPGDISVASIGSRNGAHKVKGTVDLRGIPLPELAGHCAQAKFLVGPSSGAVHFAMHCGLPVLTWLGNHRHHYYPQWNPLNVPLVCLPVWQPELEVVLRRFSDLWYLTESASDPVDYLVVGSRRSGHHAIIEWLTDIHQETTFTFLNDCVNASFQTFPKMFATIPSRDLLPKCLNQHWDMAMVDRINPKRQRSARLYSVEGPSLDEIAHLREAQNAKRVVIVLRDSMNQGASLHKTFPEWSKKGDFIAVDLQEMLGRAHEYLFEAVGVSDRLSSIRDKLVFISYNRWHADPAYRADLALELTGKRVDVRRNATSHYGPKSGFQPGEQSPQKLETGSRWRSAIEDVSFATGTCSPEVFAAEKEFHGDEFLPLANIESAWLAE